MSTVAPPDNGARLRILESLDETLFVQAGAGTGKTTALTGRIVNLVARDGVSMANIAAITFTRKAAGELRDRVRQKLEKAARGEGDFTDAERERCVRAAREVDSAAIETLDAFASRIVADHPLEAGLPPRYEMLDEVQAAIAFEDAWETFRSGFLAEPDFEAVLLRAFALGMKPSHLRDIAWRLRDDWDRLDPEAWAGSGLLPVNIAEVLAPLREACSHMDLCGDPSDLLYSHLLEVGVYFHRLAAESDDDLLDVLTDGTKLTCGRGKKGNWHGIEIVDLRDLLTQADAARTESLSELRSGVLAAILRRMCEFSISFAEQRRREGRQGFHDILVRARNLLLTYTEVRAAAHERYQRLLIDEFQDTDPMQIEIAVLIAGDWDGRGEFRWQDVGVPPGRLFFVGDPKQSIYRFRRADIEVYRSVQERFQANLVLLQSNFRSQRGILDWVNAVFPRMLTGEPGQAEYVDLEPPGEAGEEPYPAVYRLGGAVEPPKDGKVNADIVRRAESDDVVRAIKTIIGGRWQVSDSDAVSSREARYQDIAILLPARTSLSTLERALEDADIPFRVEARSLIYGTAEVRDLLAVLRSLSDPTDEVSLVAALRAPAFACSDQDLYDWHAAGGLWDYLSEFPAGESRVHEAMVWLRATHLRRWAMGVAKTVESVIRERRMFELALAHKRPRDHWKRLRLIMDQARVATEGGATSLGQFLRTIDQLAEAGGSADSIIPDADDDAVRILTIHSAKGLEFPIVVMAGLGTKDRTNSDSVQLAWSGSELRMKVGPKDERFHTPGYDDAAGSEVDLETKEAERLLYVAATRARDHLLLCLHHNTKYACHARRLHAHVEATAESCSEFEFAPGGCPITENGDAPVEDQPYERDGWLSLRKEQAAKCGTFSAIAATAVAKAAQAVEGDGGLTDEDFRDDAQMDETPSWKRGRAGTAIGRAVHAVLQSIEFNAGRTEIDAAAAHHAVAEGIPRKAGEISRLVRNALSLPLVRRVAAEGLRHWREVYVAHDFDGVTLEGFIDLLIETPEGYTVADFKTDAGDPDEAMQRYRLQGASYALCVEALLNGPVTRCVFLFAQAQVERDVENLSAACAEVREIVAAHGSVSGNPPS